MKKTETTLTWLLVIFSLSLITLNSLNSSNQEFNFGNTSSVNNTDLNNVETKENNVDEELILGAASIKCGAMTKNYQMCSRNAKSGSNYCSQHGTKNVNDNGYRYTSTCSAIAKSTGVQCRNKAKNGGMYCGRHD